MMNPTSVAATMSATGSAENPRRSISCEAIIWPSTNAEATAMPKPVMETGPRLMLSAWWTVAFGGEEHGILMYAVCGVSE